MRDTAASWQWKNFARLLERTNWRERKIADTLILLSWRRIHCRTRAIRGEWIHFFYTPSRLGGGAAERENRNVWWGAPIFRGCSVMVCREPVTQRASARNSLARCSITLESIVPRERGKKVVSDRLVADGRANEPAEWKASEKLWIAVSRKRDDNSSGSNNRKL